MARGGILSNSHSSVSMSHSFTNSAGSRADSAISMFPFTSIKFQAPRHYTLKFQVPPHQFPGTIPSSCRYHPIGSQALFPQVPQVPSHQVPGTIPSSSESHPTRSRGPFPQFQVPSHLVPGTILSSCRSHLIRAGPLFYSLVSHLVSITKN